MRPYLRGENLSTGESGKVMTVARPQFAAVLLLVLLAPALRSAAQNTETFKARLSTVPIDMTMRATIAGSGSLTAVLSGNKLVLDGKFAGLRSPATLAEIHRAPKGLRGPAILDLKVAGDTSGTIGGTLELTPEQVEDLKNARLYVQINSRGAPEGNLRGWLLP